MRSFPTDGLSESKAAVIQMFWKTDNPIHIGTVAVNLKWPLAWAEQLLDLMVAEGSVRLCTTAENRAFGITHGFFPQKTQLGDSAPEDMGIGSNGSAYNAADTQLVDLALASDLQLGGGFACPSSSDEADQYSERGSRIRHWLREKCRP